VKQAQPGRQPTTASLTLGCWNIRSLRQRPRHPPLGRQLYSLELDHLGIQLASVVKPGGVHLDQSKKNIAPYFGMVLRMVKNSSRELV